MCITYIRDYIILYRTKKVNRFLMKMYFFCTFWRIAQKSSPILYVFVQYEAVRYLWFFIIGNGYSDSRHLT